MLNLIISVLCLLYIFEVLKLIFYMYNSYNYNPEKCYHYAIDKNLQRYERGEAAISSSYCYSYLYARNVIKGRFELGEKAISENEDYAFYYTFNVIKTRFKLGEKSVILRCSSSDHAAYTKDFLGYDHK